MSITCDAYRARIGAFCQTIPKIIAKKRKKKVSSRTGQGHFKKHNAKRELCSWFAGVSCSLAYCLFVLLLTQSMDVETNPGPCTENCSSILERTIQQTEERFGNILQTIRAHSSGLSQQIAESFSNVGTVLNTIQTDIQKIKENIQENRDNIYRLQQDSECTRDRLERLEDNMERLETTSRQANLKFFGIYDQGRRDEKGDIEELVAALNYCSPQRSWKTSDIESTHRLGRPRRESDDPRPLIATFSSARDKLMILRDRELRDNLRREGIKVSADLTPRQREKIQQLRQEGKKAFFVNGQLRVENDTRTVNNDRRRAETSTSAQRQPDRRYGGHDADTTSRRDSRTSYYTGQGGGDREPRQPQDSGYPAPGGEDPHRRVFLVPGGLHPPLPSACIPGNTPGFHPPTIDPTLAAMPSPTLGNISLTVDQPGPRVDAPALWSSDTPQQCVDPHPADRSQQHRPPGGETEDAGRERRPAGQLDDWSQEDREQPEPEVTCSQTSHQTTHHSVQVRDSHSDKPTRQSTTRDTSQHESQNTGQQSQPQPHKQTAVDRQHCHGTSGDSRPDAATTPAPADPRSYAEVARSPPHTTDNVNTDQADSNIDLDDTVNTRKSGESPKSPRRPRSETRKTRSKSVHMRQTTLNTTQNTTQK